MTSQPDQQTILTHILTNISRSKGNQAVTFGQLKVCRVGNTFLKKSYAIYTGETIPRPFSEKSKLTTSLDQLP